MKFESGLHPKIKKFIGYQEIFRFLILEKKCRIYDEDSKARSTHYKSVKSQKNEKFGNQNHSKSYVIPIGYQNSFSNQMSTLKNGKGNGNGNGNNGGGTSTSLWSSYHQIRVKSRIFLRLCLESIMVITIIQSCLSM